MTKIPSDLPSEEVLPAHLRPNTTVDQRRAAFERLALPGPVNCVACGVSTPKHVQMLCAECFKRLGAPPPQSQAPIAPDPSCAFCGRAASTIDTKQESMVAGKTAMICSTCASAVAGTIGAKTGAEARAMMASSALQAEAIARCTSVMALAAIAADSAFVTQDGGAKKLGELSGAGAAAEIAVDLAHAAEALARIAKGHL